MYTKYYTKYKYTKYTCRRIGISIRIISSRSIGISIRGIRIVAGVSVSVAGISISESGVSVSRKWQPNGRDIIH